MTEIQTIESKEIAKKNSKKGFTLVELVVVIAILAILAAIAIPVVSSIINSSTKSAAESNAQTIELAIKECQSDITSKNDETYDGSSSAYKSTQKVAASKDSASAANHITVADVASIKGINDAFSEKSYNGANYTPYWIKGEGKVVYLTTTAGSGAGGTSTLTDMNGKTTSANSAQSYGDTGVSTALTASGTSGVTPATTAVVTLK